MMGRHLIWVVALAAISIFWVLWSDRENPSEAPAPQVLSQAQFDNWSGQARALLDHAPPGCWVLVARRGDVSELTDDRIRALSQAVPGTVTLDRGDVCYLCQDVHVIRQIPVWVLQAYLHDQVLAGKTPLRVVASDL
jgi:hypothetical protein